MGRHMRVMLRDRGNNDKSWEGMGGGSIIMTRTMHDITLHAPINGSEA